MSGNRILQAIKESRVEYNDPIIHYWVEGLKPGQKCCRCDGTDLSGEDEREWGMRSIMVNGDVSTTNTFFLINKLSI